MILGCVEPFDFATETFDNAIIIEATITDEFKNQEVHLSRTFKLEENGPAPEVYANVSLSGDDGILYDFYETTPGTYISFLEFAAQEGVSYELEIITSEGKSYISEPTEIVPNPGIDNLYVSKEENDEGSEGLAFLVDNSGNSTSTNYFRYEYEETYKIVSPYKTTRDLVVVDGVGSIVPKTKEEYICYNTKASNKIILASTNSFAINALEAFEVRFVPKNDPVLAQRYSLLVKQFALTQEAYTYFATLEKFAGSDDLFSQNQPGFIQGNLFSVDNPEEKVIGYFNVASVVSKRIFVDYLDYFLTSDRGEFLKCQIVRPEYAIQALAALESGRAKFIGYSYGPPNEEGKGPIRIVAAPCVDCTLLGSNVKPEFWVEETE